MPTNTIDGYTFTVNDEGFFTNREEWSEPLAEILAGLVGIDDLTETHWAALRFMRDDQAKTGMTPTLRRRVCPTNGVSGGSLFSGLRRLACGRRR